MWTAISRLMRRAIGGLWCVAAIVLVNAGTDLWNGQVMYAGVMLLIAAGFATAATLLNQRYG